jgi:hypothetical protein
MTYVGRRAPFSVALMALVVLSAGAAFSSAEAQGRDAATPLREFPAGLRTRRGTVLGLMGYNVIPDGSANAVRVDRSTQGGSESSAALILGQFGFGFTVSDSVPLFVEAYVGYARYDPRVLFSNGEVARRLPLRWNNVAATLGIGYDIRLADSLWLRPIVNASIGYAASDAGLLGSLINYRTGADIAPLTDAHVNVYGRGGSLALAYYDYRPERDIDFELRYTQIELETFGDTLPAARGSSTARTLGLWTRYRWPTGWEAFGRPVRWVLDGSASTYLGDQRDALGFSWSAKLGGGIEFDIGRHEIGLLGIDVSRVRLIGRYFFADRDVTGVSFGLGISF